MFDDANDDDVGVGVDVTPHRFLFHSFFHSFNSYFVQIARKNWALCDMKSNKNKTWTHSTRSRKFDNVYQFKS